MDSQHFSNRPVVNEKRILIAVVVALAAIIAIMLLKPSPPKPPQPPLPGLPPGPEKLKTMVGTVVGYKYNPHFDVNSVEINSGQAGVITIDFLPHTASAVMKVGAVGESVLLTYSLRPDNESVGYHLEEIKNTRTGELAKLDELPSPPRIPDRAAENFDLLNPTLITDNYGGIVALKKDSLLFHFKPGLVDDIMPLMKTNHRFGLMAVRREGNLGFINVNHDKVYIVISVTVDNKTFLVR